jgi:drug/metabolite transporter (DMT)-like permease
MAKLILILLIGLVLEALGVVYLSAGLKEIAAPKQMSFNEIRRVAARGIVNRNILIGVGMEAAFFITLLILLKFWDVSLVWPLTSLGFVLTTLAAKYIRHEDVNAMRWAGVFLIMAGAVLVGYSEKLKTPAQEPGAAAEVNRE